VKVEVRRVFAGDGLPRSVGSYAGLVVMGGPMSARSDETFGTRSREVELLGEALERGIPTLGVCLGAQLLALAGGGAVHAGGRLEVGWGKVQLTDPGDGDRLFGGLPDQLEVLHWHGDTFTLPDAAVHLARSELYENQAFRFGSCAWGLQFHVEVDAAAVEEFVAAFGDEAIDGGTSPEAIAAGMAEALERLGPYRRLIVDRFAGLVARGSG
jgi:GMP synthase-like glutamine amidotransferase